MNATRKTKAEAVLPSAVKKLTETPLGPLGEDISKKRFRFSIPERIYRVTEKLRASGMTEAQNIDLGELHEAISIIQRSTVFLPDEKKEISAEISSLLKAAEDKCLALVHKIPHHPAGFGATEMMKPVDLKAALVEILAKMVQ